MKEKKKNQIQKTVNFQIIWFGKLFSFLNTFLLISDSVYKQKIYEEMKICCKICILIWRHFGTNNENKSFQ